MPVIHKRHPKSHNHQRLIIISPESGVQILRALLRLGLLVRTAHRGVLVVFVLPALELVGDELAECLDDADVLNPGLLGTIARGVAALGVDAWRADTGRADARERRIDVT